jgi:hypothetical protein
MEGGSQGMARHGTAGGATKCPRKEGALGTDSSAKKWKKSNKPEIGGTAGRHGGSNQK